MRLFAFVPPWSLIPLTESFKRTQSQFAKPAACTVTPPVCGYPWSAECSTAAAYSQHGMQGFVGNVQYVSLGVLPAPQLLPPSEKEYIMERSLPLCL